MLARIALTFAALTLPIGAQAQEERGWTGEFALNGSVTTGNNETTDVGFATKIANRGSDWRHTFKASADYGRSQGDTNKRRYRLGYKIGRDLAPRVYSFLNADYYSDDFSAYKHGQYFGGGVGYSVLVDGPTLWRLETGVGYRSQKARLLPGTIGGEASRKEEFVSGRLYSDFEHRFNANVQFSNDTELLYSDIDTYFINDTSLTSTLFGSLAVRASYRIETHSKVPEGGEKTDTVSRIGIVYKME